MAEVSSWLTERLKLQVSAEMSGIINASERQPSLALPVLIVDMAAAEKASSYFVVLPTERRPMIEIMRRVGGKVISSYLDSGAGDVLSEAGPLLMANLSLRSVDAAGGVPLGRKLR